MEYKQTNAVPQMRFYYIKVKGIKNISDKFNDTEKHQLVFKLGDKKSETKFSITKENQATQTDLKRFKQQAHMFCYQPQQLMLVKISSIDTKDVKFIGYSNILLTPLIKMPYTKHQVTINMVFQNKNKSIDKDISAIVEIDLYFLLKFSAKLYIEPILANLSHNTASFGQMKPFVIFTINKEEKRTEIVEGGIHPKWSEKPKQNDLNWIKSKQVAQFNLKTLSAELEISINSAHIVGDGYDFVGSNVVKLQQYGFFKKPNYNQIYDEKDGIILYFGENMQRVAGKLSIKSYIQFNFKELGINEQQQ